jgi:hypothetical protein
VCVVVVDAKGRLLLVRRRPSTAWRMRRLLIVRGACTVLDPKCQKKETSFVEKDISKIESRLS